MNKRHLQKILVLAILLLLLGATLYLQRLQRNRHREPQKTEALTTSQRIQGLLEGLADQSDIRRIVIEPSESSGPDSQLGSRLELSLREKSSENARPSWQLDFPKAFSVREGSIETLARSVLNLRGKTLVAADFDLSQEVLRQRYGFTWLTVDLFAEKENETPVGRILLGGKIPGLAGHYATVVSENSAKLLYSISQDQVKRLAVQPNGLRNKFLPAVTLLSSQQEHLKTLELRSYSNVLRIEFKDEELAERYSSLNELQSFVMTKPYPSAYGVDQYQLEQLLKALPNPIEIVQYIAEDLQDSPDLSQYGLAEGQRQEFYVEDNSGKRLALWVGREADRESVYAKQSDYGSVFTIGKQVLSVFNFEPFKIVDKFVILLNISRIDRIQLLSQEGPSYSLKIRHRLPFDSEDSSSQDVDGGELFEASTLRSLDSDLTKDLYQEFLSIFFVGQVPDSFFPVDKAELSMLYSLRDGKKRRADFYNYSAKGYYVVSMDGGKATFIVEKRALKELQQTLLRVLDTGQLNIVQ